MKRLKSRKALSPVVASIILIAVTVAVSLAVAAWMGALTFGFVGTTSMTINKVTFADYYGNSSQGSGQSNNTIILAVKNTGTRPVTLSQIRINNVAYSNFTGNPSLTWTSGQNGTITVGQVGWSNGNPYAINLFDSTGTGVGSTQATAPAG
jgi:flagellin-like protein